MDGRVNCLAKRRGGEGGVIPSTARRRLIVPTSRIVQWRKGGTVKGWMVGLSGQLCDSVTGWLWVRIEGREEANAQKGEVEPWRAAPAAEWWSCAPRVKSTPRRRRRRRRR